MLGYQSTWGLQTAIVALEDRSLDHAGGSPYAASMRVTANVADAPQRFERWAGAKIGMGTRQKS
jgi:hypothetical protein